MCAQPTPGPSPRPRQRVTPIQWAGLAVFVAFLLYRLGFFSVGDLGSPQGFIGDSLPLWVGLALAITFHEFSHGLVATLFGDTTPRLAGRLTLNPLKHLDPVGSIMMVLGGIGWGRPMPINPAAMRNPALGWALSSLAGPVSNLLLAFATLLAYSVAQASAGSLIGQYLLLFARLNVSLAVFNLIPLFPLDGFGFFYGLSPAPIKQAIGPLVKYCPIVLLALLFLPSFLPGFPPILTEFVLIGGRFFLQAIQQGIQFVFSV